MEGQKQKDPLGSYGNSFKQEMKKAWTRKVTMEEMRSG